MTTPDEEEVPLRRQRRSVSQLTSYSSCGEAYRLQKVVKAPQKPAAWFIQGHAIHEAIEAWENGGRTTPEAELHDLYMTTFINEANEQLEKMPPEHWMKSGIKKTETDLSDRMELGWWQTQDYMAIARREEELWEVVASEVEFTVPIGTVDVTGAIDQVRRDLASGELYAADLKSGNNTPPMPVQLAVYRIALTKMQPDDSTDVIQNRAEWIHLGKPETKSKPQRSVEAIEIDLTDWPESRVERWLYDMDRAEKLGIYLPNPSDKCERLCSVQQWCRAMTWHLPSAEQYAQGLLDPINKEQHD